jgi:tripartite-type tricarboxylate transporter receptor subunit TctC
MMKRLAIAALALLATAPSWAQEKYPARPVEIIVPWGPGGGADQLARTVAKLLEPMLNTSFPVVNVPGATGGAGMAKLLAAPADGYSMAIYIADSHALLAGKSPRWTLADIQPVAVMIKAPSFLFASDKGPYKTWADFEKAVRASPGKLKVATLGFGSVDDMSLAHFAAKGLKVIQVPYAKPSERYVSVIGGHVDALYEQAGDVRQFITSGQIHPIMVFGKERFPAFKDAPASYELGIKVGLPQFRSLVIKAGTPPERVKILSDALAKVAATPEYKAFLEAQYGTSDSFMNAAEAGPFLKAQLDEMKGAGAGK